MDDPEEAKRAKDEAKAAKKAHAKQKLHDAAVRGTGGVIGDAMNKARAVQDDPDGNPVDYGDLYCRLVRKAVGDLLPEEQAAIRLW